MKHMKLEPVPATEKLVLDKRTCDICQLRIESPRSWGVEHIEVSALEGKQYPECGSGEKCQIDLCMDCFRNKLIPFIDEESDGEPIKWEEWDN